MLIELTRIQRLNRLISEFMAIRNEDGTFHVNEKGGYIKGTLHFNTPGLPVNHLFPYEHQYYDANYGQWNHNWSWLMPVLDKIEALGHHTVASQSYVTGYQYINIMTGTSIMLQSPDNPTKFMGMAKLKIDAYYQAITEFIEWYNKRKANTEPDVQ
jgi:hypothetical protein